MSSSILIFIQKLLKHSKSWINFFAAPTGAEVKVFAAVRTQTLTVLLTEELAVHIQNEAGGQNLVQIYFVTLKQKTQVFAQERGVSIR